MFSLTLPLLVAAGSALLSYFVMQARMEVALAKERESLAEARAIIHSQKSTMEERIKATEEAARRAALDDLMRDFRVEERSYMRENRGLARRSMVMQERVFFRNIPLSNWTEHEMLIEDGGQALPDHGQVAQAAFHGPAPVLEPGQADGRLPISKQVAQVPLPAPPEQKAPKTVAMPQSVRESRESQRLMPVAAFGAQ